MYLYLDKINAENKRLLQTCQPVRILRSGYAFWLQSRGLHGGPETRGPGTRTGSGLYFKWSAGSGSGPNLWPRVRGLFNIPESIGEHRTREWSVSVSMRVFCNLQFVKLGWEKCEREIRWKKKHALPQPPEVERGRSQCSSLQTDGDHGFLHEWCEKKAATKLKRRTCYWTRTQ